MKFLRWSFVWVALGGIGFVGCVSSSELRLLRQDLFNVQTRLLSLEKQIEDENKDAKDKGSAATKRIAESQVSFDKLSRDLQKIQGELDRLQVGVETGELPGTSSDKSSIAKKLQELEDRLGALEGGKVDGGENRAASPPKSQVKASDENSGAKGKLDSLGEVKAAFSAKQFKKIVEESEGALKAGKESERIEVCFLQGESFYKLERYREAILKYEELLAMKPAKKYQSQVRLRIGDSFKHLGDNDTARIYYEEIVRSHSSSKEAAAAKDHLAKLPKK